MKFGKNKKIILICVIFLVLFLTVIGVFVDKKAGYMYIHLFYIPVIIASFWFYFHAFWVVAFLSLVMLASAFCTGMSFNLSNVIFEAVMLSATVLLIVYLKKNNNSIKGECEEEQNLNCSGKETEGFIEVKTPADISDETELVLREVYHRMKNNIQIVTSLISLQIVKESNEAAKSALLECQNRVKVMSIIHEKLYTSESSNFIEMHGYVETLTSYLLRAYHVDKDKIKVIIDVKPVYLDLNTAIPLSQMINEILSNSIKHAFVFKEYGEVVISLSLTQQENSVYTLSISDNGSGFPDNVSFPDKGKLGFHLISGLAKQMGGVLKHESSPGTFFEFAFKTK